MYLGGIRKASQPTFENNTDQEKLMPVFRTKTMRLQSLGFLKYVDETTVRERNVTCIWNLDEAPLLLDMPNPFEVEIRSCLPGRCEHPFLHIHSR
jgi:hypothetical protein